MYVWVVLTTFLAMLAAYVLPIRQDTQEMVTVPVAQARLSQMTAKHEAGILYMRENAYPYVEAGEDGERPVGYSSGQISDDVLDDYVPFGFVNSREYVTAIYCMDKDMTMVRTGEDACVKTDENRVQRLLVTYGPIPERWRVVNDGVVMPSADFMQALRKQFVVKEMVGYAVKGDNPLAVINYEGTRYEVPQPVADDGAIVGYTIRNCLEDYEACLMFMSWQ